MGETVELPGDSGAGGYLAPALEGAGLGLVVILEGSGPVDHGNAVCDRFAAEGFTALAPDVRPPDATAPDLRRAAEDLSAAVDFLRDHGAVRGHGVAVVGFGVGGALALWLASVRPDAVRAAVPFYGLPVGTNPDWSALTAAVEGHFAEHDDLADKGAVAAFEETLRDLGKEVRVFTYPGTGHGFFDDTRPGSFHEDAARQAWVRTLEFLRAKLG